MIAPQAARGLGNGALVGQAALNVLKIALALAGFPLRSVDTAVGWTVIQHGAGDVNVHGDLMAIAQVLVNIGGGHLAGGNGADADGGCIHPGAEAASLPL